MRWEVVKQLTIFLESNHIEPKSICIVGGSSFDPEVVLLKSRFETATIHYVGIENYGSELNWFDLDLNSNANTVEEFDLVICSQVLEHVWNMSTAFDNLSLLTKKGGYIWVNCPTSNIAHGSPEYYSAGYSPEFLIRNMELHNFTRMLAMNIGSERCYKATHLLGLWSSEKEHRRPILGYRISKPITKGKVLEFLNRIPGRLQMLAWNPQVSEQIKFATETVYAGRKFED